MKIRKATKKDLSELVRLYLKYRKENESLAGVYKQRWQLSKKEISKYILESISKKNNFLMVLDEEGVLKGFIFGSFEKKEDSIKNYGSINEIYVVPEMRGKGFSSQLKDEFVKWFKEKKKGKGIISLYVMPKNEVAKKSYQKGGFEVSDLKLVREMK